MKPISFTVLRVRTYLYVGRWTDRWPTRESNDLRPTEEKQARRHRIVGKKNSIWGPISRGDRCFTYLLSPCKISQHMNDRPSIARLDECLGVKCSEAIVQLEKKQKQNKNSSTYIPEFKHVLCVDAKVLHFNLGDWTRESYKLLFKIN